MATDDLNTTAAAITVLAFDVDGVLTDGGIGYTAGGEEIKTFHVRDGHAMKMAARAGLTVALITGRESAMVLRRAGELGIDPALVYQGVKDKTAVLQKLLAATGASHGQVAYLGDDVVDIPIMRLVGLGAAVADAPAEVRDAALYVTEAAGGRGAARELIVLILKAGGHWKDLMARYLE